MLKPILFTSLYAIIGVSGWNAYSIISEQDTSVASITDYAKQTNDKLHRAIQGTNKPIYRYKDEHNNWIYSDKPLDPTVTGNYDNELAFLRSLPKEAMPTSSFEVSQLTKTVATQESVNPEKLNVKDLMQEAKKVVKMLEDRNDLLDSLLHNKPADSSSN